MYRYLPILCLCSICYNSNGTQIQWRTCNSHCKADHKRFASAVAQNIPALVQHYQNRINETQAILDRTVAEHDSDTNSSANTQAVPHHTYNISVSDNSNPTPDFLNTDQPVQSALSGETSRRHNLNHSIHSYESAHSTALLLASGEMPVGDMEAPEFNDIPEIEGFQETIGIEDGSNEDDFTDESLPPFIHIPQHSPPNQPDPTILPISLSPAFIASLQQDLIGDYTPPEMPTSPPEHEPLKSHELLSLRHYIAWKKTNGTVQAYNEHRNVLQNATGEDVLSLHLVRILALRIAKLTPLRIDMCRRSCTAYTGSHSNLDRCPYIHVKEKQPCNEPRFRTTPRGTKVPQAQVTVLPILPTIHALFANANTSRLLRHRDKCLKEVLHLVGTASTNPSRHQYSDFANGSVHQHHYRRMGLFQDARDVALALSSDGAQLTMKKQSSTWILIIILLNLPPEIRYQSENVIINFAVPGPNTPGDIESFLRPLFEELAEASAGIWIWDALDSAYFLHRSYACMILGDMLGSAKLNGMSGHSAIFGDRFSTVQAAKSSKEKGARAQYYPLSPPQSDLYNPTRPKQYTQDTVVMRKQSDYMETLSKLVNAQSKREQAAISKITGVSRIPLAVASPAFTHPHFFPLDPFHLFYENCMPAMYDIWSTGSSTGEAVHVSGRKMQLLGELIANANETLPPSFSGPIRNPYLKRQSQYKAYEWMALLHWYILPIGIEIGISPLLLGNFAQFVHIVEFAMTIKSRSHADLCELQSTVWKFLQQYETLYVGSDPEKIYRCRLCIFQLIHVPMHIKWFGSIRTCSQSTVERAIGEVGHKIHSKKEPFANLTNIIIETETIRLVKLYYPVLQNQDNSQHPNHSETKTNIPFQNLQISKCAQFQDKISKHLNLLASYLSVQPKLLTEKRQNNSKNLEISANSDLESHQYVVKLYGKVKLYNGKTLRSRISEAQSLASRKYRWFELIPSVQSPQTSAHRFGEAIAFYTIEMPDGHLKRLAVYIPLVKVQQLYPTVIRGEWPQDLEGSSEFVMELDSLSDLIGIWRRDHEGTSQNVYILRKHPAQLYLQPHELGVICNEDMGDLET